MQQYYFPFDKNYILKEAQASIKDRLLNDAVLISRERFLEAENPMGLIDSFIAQLINAKDFEIQHLDSFYDLCSAVYRYKFADNQLEFVWDGSSNYEQYQKEWEQMFHSWISDLAQYKSFRRIILKMCILHPESNHMLIAGHLNKFILNKFSLKFFKNRKGLRVA